MPLGGGFRLRCWKTTTLSGAFPQPRLSSIEHGVREFHREIQRVLPVAALRNAPQTGTVARVNEELQRA